MDKNQIISASCIAGWAVFMALLERRFPYVKGQKLFRPYFFVDWLWFSIIFSYLMGFIVYTWIAPAIDAATGLSKLGLISQWPIWAQCALLIFGHDLFIYWFHRMMHSNKYLWRFHEAHHSPVEVDWAAGARAHVLESLVVSTVEFSPLILLGAAPETALVKGVIAAAWGMWIHSNIDVKSGWLQYIVNGPEMHRWHHSKEVHNINFATKFAFWDWIFGTAYLPKTKPINYGIDDPFPGNLIKQQLFAFRPFPTETNAGSAPDGSTSATPAHTHRIGDPA